MMLGSASVASLARADGTALWVEQGVRDADRRALRSAVAAELGVTIVEADDALSRVRRSARRLPADRTSETVAREEQAALRAYLHLRFGDAERAWDRTIDALLASARVEEDPAVLSALLDAAEPTRRRESVRRGSEIFRARVVAEAAEAVARVTVDIVLPDGEWLRIATLETGEIVIADLPAGTADLRVRVGP